MGTIKLQIDVVRHMSVGTLASEVPLSLFSNQQEFTSLAAKVIVSSKDIGKGFELAFLIIQVVYVGLSVTKELEVPIYNSLVALWSLNSFCVLY